MEILYPIPEISLKFPNNYPETSMAFIHDVIKLDSFCFYNAGMPVPFQRHWKGAHLPLQA